MEKKGQKVITGEDIKKFLGWVYDVDQMGACDLFDMALGWFSALGYEHRDVCDTAAKLQASDYRTVEDAR
jgi:hypothetical protein